MSEVASPLVVRAGAFDGAPFQVFLGESDFPSLVVDVAADGSASILTGDGSSAPETELGAGAAVLSGTVLDAVTISGAETETSTAIDLGAANRAVVVVDFVVTGYAGVFMTNSVALQVDTSVDGTNWNTGAFVQIGFNSSFRLTPSTYSPGRYLRASVTGLNSSAAATVTATYRAI